MGNNTRAVLTLPTLALAVVTASCAVNPATGGRQLSLISERQEIAMGEEGARQVERSMGLYDDAELQRYVGRVGTDLAAVSERPDLPWSFGVVDDPTVNAFALPGGFIYMTRGILAHFNSEAEMAAVLGHEIGHVTARHSVTQISRAQVAQLGLGVASIFVEPVREYGGLLGAGLGLAFLQFSRDDEREADMLGIRYSLRTDYDPREAIHVFEMLQRQTEEAGGSGVPGWLSTHPTPEDRIERIQAIVDTVSEARLAGTRVDRQAYLRGLEGMVYGPNPRHGFFRGSLFLHPDMAFQLRFPEGWRTRNLARAVVAQSPGEDAIVQLTLADERGHRAAAEAFLAQEGVQGSRPSRESVNGHPATSARFRANVGDGTLEGLALWVDYGGRTFQLLGYTAAGRMGTHERAMTTSLRSFDRLTDREALAVQPMRIGLVRADDVTSIEELAREHGAPVSTARLALLNGIGEQTAIQPGTLIKWVEGRPPPGQ